MDTKTFPKSNDADAMPKKPPNKERWSQERVLKEARKRTHEQMVESAKQTQRLLDELLREAGWTNEEFLDAFIQDVVSKDQRRRRR